MTDEKTSSELAEWNPPMRKTRRGNRDSSSSLLGQVKVGEVRRIYHDDCKCLHSSDGWRCSLLAKISAFRSVGIYLEHYHEAEHVIVVRRKDSP